MSDQRIERPLRRRRTDERIAAAAMRLLRDDGPDAVTMAAVGRSAHIGKATLYRRYPNRDELLKDVVLQITEPGFAELAHQRAITSSHTLEEVIGSLRKSYTDHVGSTLLGHVLASSSQSMRTWRDTIFATHREILRSAFRKGVAAGALKADADYDRVIELIMGGLVISDAMLDAPASGWAHQTAALLWSGIAAGTAARDTGPRPGDKSRSCSAEAARRPGGRSERVRRSVLDATVAVVEEQGLAGVTFTAVAERAGVHPSSVSRRWGSVESLVLDAIDDAAQAVVTIPDTGSFQTDLVEQARIASDYLGSRRGHAMLQALTMVGEDQPMRRARAAALLRRLPAFDTLVERAVQRGEVAAGTDPQHVLELLMGPVMTRTILLREPMDRRSCIEIAHTIAHGLRPDGG